MGSKNLKAVVVCGDREPLVCDSDGVNIIASRLRQRSLSALTDKYRHIGTVANLAVFNRLGVLPAHNFQQSTFDDAEALNGETLSETNFARRHGCASCSIRCERLFKSLNGEEQRLEYETLFALGPLSASKSRKPCSRPRDFVMNMAWIRLAPAAHWHGRWNAAKKDSCLKLGASVYASAGRKGFSALSPLSPNDKG